MRVPPVPQRASGRAPCICGLGYLERSSGRSPATGEAQRWRSWTVRSRSVGALKRPHSRQYSGAGKGLTLVLDQSAYRTHHFVATRDRPLLPNPLEFLNVQYTVGKGSTSSFQRRKVTKVTMMFTDRFSHVSTI